MKPLPKRRLATDKDRAALKKAKATGMTLDQLRKEFGLDSAKEQAPKSIPPSAVDNVAVSTGSGASTGVAPAPKPTEGSSVENKTSDILAAINQKVATFENNVPQTAEAVKPVNISSQELPAKLDVPNAGPSVDPNGANVAVIKKLSLRDLLALIFERTSAALWSFKRRSEKVEQSDMIAIFDKAMHAVSCIQPFANSLSNSLSNPFSNSFSNSFSDHMQESNRQAAFEVFKWCKLYTKKKMEVSYIPNRSPKGCHYEYQRLVKLADELLHPEKFRDEKETEQNHLEFDAVVLQTDDLLRRLHNDEVKEGILQIQLGEDAELADAAKVETLSVRDLLAFALERTTAALWSCKRRSNKIEPSDMTAIFDKAVDAVSRIRPFSDYMQEDDRQKTIRAFKTLKSETRAKEKITMVYNRSPQGCLQVYERLVKLTDELLHPEEFKNFDRTELHLELDTLVVKTDDHLMRLPDDEVKEGFAQIQ